MRVDGSNSDGLATPVGRQGQAPAVSFEADGLHFRDYLRVLYKRRRLAAAVMLVVSLSAFLYAVTATPIYDATVRLQIETQAPNVLSFGEVVSETGLVARSEFYRTQYEVLRSRSLARKTIDLLSLWDHPVIVPKAGASFNPVQLVTSWVGSLHQPDGAVADNESRAKSRALDTFLDALTVSPVRDSRIVDVTFSSPDPSLSAAVANTLAGAYIEQELAFRHESSQEATHWLWERLEDQRQEVETAELAMQRYRESKKSVSLDDHQNVIGQELADLNEAATRAATERIAKEARFRELVSLQGDAEALGRFPDIVGNAYVQEQRLRLAELRREEFKLAEDLGDLHPDLISIRSTIRDTEVGLRVEIAKIVDSVRTEFEIARNLEAQLHEALQQQTDEALALDRAGIEYGVLTRDAESARRVYESLLQRADEMGISSELQTTNIRIVDEAETPLHPSRPRRGRTVLFGIMLGLFGSIGLVFLAEHLDDRLRTPEEVKRLLGRPCLGMLPESELVGSDGRLRIGSDAPDQFAAAVRVICTSVIFSSASDGCRTVVITSPEPGDGKSIMSCNLALALAQTGSRTLLVDADLIRSHQHVLWRQDVTPGLTDLLAEQADENGVIRESGVDRLWLMTSGTKTPNSTALMASNRFASLLSKLRDRFDWIVLDTPPTLPVTDATICAHLANQVVFVVDAESTSHRAAAAALERLEQSGTSISGIVLNRVGLNSHPYYYSAYYRRGYHRYYQHA